MTREWVTVGEFADLHEAEWEAARLREAGINAQVHDPTTDEYEPDPTANVRVLVEPKDAERARAVLATDGEPPEEQDSEPETSEDDPCPLLSRERIMTLDAAYRAAVVGILFPPMLLRSAWLMVAAFQKPGPTGVTGWFWLAVAIGLNVGAVVAWLLVLPGFFR